MQTGPMTVAPAAGFADAVQQSQIAFRALLDAMARPGRIATMPADIGHPAGMAPAVAGAALTLCDLDTQVWLGPGFDTDGVRNWLRFHTGASLVADASAADFALIDAAAGLPALDGFSLGTDMAPERGATLLIQVAGLAGGAAMTWRGPGIKDGVAMPFCGLPATFWQARTAQAGEFPRGLDVYLCAGAEVVGLPRSTAITLATEA
jgi:alpha-D-ribose 1-methylphosphonate 5-triphosphate synthase subunit PhnH